MSLRVLRIPTDSRWVAMEGPQLRRYGVPEAGPFDRESWAWCVALANVTNAIEIGPFGAQFECEKPVSVAITGAVRSIDAGGKPVGNGLVNLRPGERLTLGPVSLGARSYLAPFNVHPVNPLGLEVGQMLPGFLKPGYSPAIAVTAPSLAMGTLRVMEGPQATAFDLGAFAATEWAVALDSDRRGLRLTGEPLVARLELGEKQSEPVTVGAVQITGAGTPIAIGPDGPTLGGYPVIAVVIDADRDKLGQLIPGAVVRFVLVDATTARDLGRRYRARLRDALATRF